MENHNAVGVPHLDGKSKPVATPYDAHEQVARVQHEEAPKTNNSVHSGLVAVERAEEPQEFPKAVAHNEKTGDPIVVNSAEEEKAYLDAQADEAKADEEE